MFLDAGAEEIMVVAVVALIFVGPKDLPVVLRKVGQFTAKMRGLAAEFRASFDEMARQSELDELKREVAALRRGEAMKPLTQEIDEHFESLHREFGAPPPAGVGARENEILPGPDAAPVHMLPKSAQTSDAAAETPPRQPAPDPPPQVARAEEPEG